MIHPVQRMVNSTTWNDRRSSFHKGGVMPELKEMRQRGKKPLIGKPDYRNFYANKKVKDPNGKTIHLMDCLGTCDPKEAKRKLDRLVFIVERGEYSKHKSKVDNICDQYLESSKGSNQREESAIRLHLKPFLKGLTVADVTDQCVIDYKLHREKTGNATASSLKKELRCLKRVIQQTDSKFELPTSQNSDQMKFENPGKKLTLADIPTEQEVLEYAEVVSPSKHRLPWLIGTYCGLRRGDLVGLTKRQLLDDPNWIRGVQGKTGKPFNIPKSGKLKAILDKELKVLPLDPDAPLFPDVTPNALTMAARRAYKVLLKRTNDGRKVINISPHKIRHFTAVHLLNNGCRIEAVSMFLGHTSVKTTEIYAKLLETTTHGEVVTAFDSGGQMVDMKEMSGN
jgi:integrase/recombinase XerD